MHGLTIAASAHPRHHTRRGVPAMSDAPGRNNRGDGLSRRQFLKGSGVSAATAALTGGTGLVGQAIADEPAKKEETVGMGPGPVALSLNVDGAEMKTKVEPRVTLLDALRNYLD